MDESTSHPRQPAASGHPDIPAPPSGQPWPPYAPPQKRSPAWLMPVAIIVAALLIAGAAIAVAIITSNSNSPTADGTHPSTNTAAAPANTAESSTCRAWRSIGAALDRVQELPEGWDWDTPGIDDMIAKRDAALTKAMDLFEPQIAAHPADVATAAHAYINARRNEVQKLTNHTYTGADGIASTAGASTLDQLCHVTG